MSMRQQFPDLDQFRRAIVIAQGAIEQIRQPLYDYAIYPTAGLAALSFFVNPVGQGLSSQSGNGTAAKVLADTNMTQVGALPVPQAYWCAGVEVDFQPGSVSTANTFTIQDPVSAVTAAAAATVQAGANDKFNVLSSGALTFSVGSKQYYQEGPLYRFPTRPLVRIDASIATNSVTATETLVEYASSAGVLRSFDPGIGIMTNLNFGVVLTWPAVVATPSGFNGRMGIVLNGYLFRAVQ